ncbi:outer membrane protein assembly factor BamA [Desulfurivibrio sp. D14AmB]|uniref:outer membrane protein assembly factor BamA n=1 Tax=Desulfurivibrio sp. D14AmB TaxID=3374370 RepID=UPI00376EED7C
MKPQSWPGYLFKVVPNSRVLRQITGRLFRQLSVLLLTWSLPLAAAAGPTPANTLFLPLQILAPTGQEELATASDTALAAILQELGSSLADRAMVAELMNAPGGWPPPLPALQALERPAPIRYLAVGSLTRLGEQFSIDLSLFDLNQEEPVRYFTSGAPSLAQLSPGLKELSRQILPPAPAADLISAVHIQGNVKTGSGAILRRVSSKAGEPLDPARLQEDIKAIFAMGFFDDIQVQAEESATGTKLTFVVTEKPVIGQVIISGNRKLKESDIREVIAVLPNTIINTRLVQQAEESIVQLYKEKGYHNSQVTSATTETAAGLVDVRFEIEEGERIYIKRIKFTGNDSFRPRAIRKVMTTKTKGIFSWLTRSGRLQTDILEQDRARIAAFYHNQGFIDARVGAPEISREENRLFITFNIEEGERFTVGEIGLRGELIAPEEELLELIKLRGEEYFSRQVLRDDMMRLSDRYAQDGYAFAEVEPMVSRDDETRRIDVVFQLEKNALVHINRITIRGNTRTRDKVIRREIRVQEGGILDTSAIRKSMERLQQLGFFEEIDVRPEPALMRDDLMDLQIEVKEKPTGTFSIGAGYSSMDKLMFMGQISQDNFMGKGQRLSLQADLSANATHYNLSFTEPRLADSKLLFGIDLYNWEREYIDYTKESTGGALRFGYPLGERWNLYWGYGYEDSTLSDVSPGAPRAITDSIDLHVNSFLRLGLVRDTRNNRLDPTRGSIFDIGLKHAGGFLGGDTAFTRLESSATRFFPWDEIPLLKETRSNWLNSTTFRLKGSMGYIRENETDKLPIYEKFFLGGLRTMRGFETATISPRDPDDDLYRIGGEKMWYMNSEWIFPISAEIGLKGLIFFDAGNVYTKSDNWRTDNLKKSVGFGFRWLSPLGPLRLEWGYNLDPEDDEKRTVWDFSMGGVF